MFSLLDRCFLIVLFIGLVTRVIYNIAGTLVLKNQYDDEFKFQLQAEDLVTELMEVYSGRYVTEIKKY